MIGKRKINKITVSKMSLAQKLKNILKQLDVFIEVWYIDDAWFGEKCVRKNYYSFSVSLDRSVGDTKGFTINIIIVDNRLVDVNASVFTSEATVDDLEYLYKVMDTVKRELNKVFNGEPE